MKKTPDGILSFGNALYTKCCICCVVQVFLRCFEEYEANPFTAPKSCSAFFLVVGTEHSEKCCPGSDKSLVFGFLILHTNRPEGRKQHVAEQM